VAGDVDGEGVWEYEVEGGRVLLNFSKIEDPGCDTPFGSLVFVESSERLAAIVDVDSPTTRIDYTKARVH